MYDYQKDYKINYYNEHGMNGKMNNWYLSLTCFINSYPERRTIVRQGDRSACFYIILSGSAFLTYKRLGDDYSETLDILQRGCTFGVRIWIIFHIQKMLLKEKGLMTNSRQLFTVTTKTKLELLVLWKDVNMIAWLI